MKNKLKIIKHIAEGPCNKLVLQLPDGVQIETVFHYPRWVCVSTQVGCPISCTFCGTGENGFYRNLSCDEIVEQVLISERLGQEMILNNVQIDKPELLQAYERIKQLQRGTSQINSITEINSHCSSWAKEVSVQMTSALIKSMNTNASNFDKTRMVKDCNVFETISFSGMGEPLLNFKELTAAMQYLHEKTSSRLHISTVGIIPKLKKLFDLQVPFSLDISLHATKDPVRSRLIPANKPYPMRQLLDKVMKLNLNKKAALTICYMLLRGINDSKEDLFRLVTMFKGKDVAIELKKYNPILQNVLQRVDEEILFLFRDTLINNGLKAYIYQNEGVFINAGCGQLIWRVT